MTTLNVSTTNSSLIEIIKAFVAKEPKGTTITYEEEQVYKRSEIPIFMELEEEFKKLPKEEQQKLIDEVKAEMY